MKTTIINTLNDLATGKLPRNNALGDDLTDKLIRDTRKITRAEIDTLLGLIAKGQSDKARVYWTELIAKGVDTRTIAYPRLDHKWTRAKIMQVGMVDDLERLYFSKSRGRP